MLMYEYEPTPSLPDAEGEELLKEFWRLYTASAFDAETKKKVQVGSRAERYAIAELQTAIVKAAARFERHEEFSAWLIRNAAESIEAYDPIRGRSKQADVIRDLEWRVSSLENELRFLSKTLLDLSLSKATQDRVGDASVWEIKP